MNIAHLTREDLIEFLTCTYSGWELDGSDRIPNIPFNEWTITELYEECAEFDFMCGDATEDGPSEIWVDGILVVEDYWMVEED